LKPPKVPYPKMQHVQQLTRVGVKPRSCDRDHMVAVKTSFNPFGYDRDNCYCDKFSFTVSVISDITRM